MAAFSHLLSRSFLSCYPVLHEWLSQCPCRNGLIQGWACLVSRSQACPVLLLYFSSRYTVSAKWSEAYHPGRYPLVLCLSPDAPKLLLRWHEHVKLSSSFWNYPLTVFTTLNRSCPGVHRKQRMWTMGQQETVLLKC